MRFGVWGLRWHPASWRRGGEEPSRPDVALMFWEDLKFGFGFWILSFGFWVLGFGFRISSFGSSVLGLGFWVPGFGFWVVDSEF